MIRHAEIKDINNILNLLNQVNIIHADARPDIFNIAPKYNEDELERKIKDEPIFVHTDDSDNADGYIFGIIRNPGSSLMKDNKTFFIDDFCVDESKRGMRIGSELYKWVKIYAKEIGCKRITLNVWSFNESAYNFYLKCGLKPLETVMEEIL